MDLADISPPYTGKQYPTQHPNLPPNRPPSLSSFNGHGQTNQRTPPFPERKTSRTKKRPSITNSPSSAIVFCWPGNCVTTHRIAPSRGEKSLEYIRFHHDCHVHHCGGGIPARVSGGDVFQVGCKVGYGREDDGETKKCCATGTITTGCEAVGD